MSRQLLISVSWWTTAAALAVIVAIRSALVPFSHDEVATFYFYIQPGDFFPFTSHVDANNHFLTSAFGWMSFRLFGSSPFALRIPSLLAFLLLVYAVRRFRSLFVSATVYFAFAACVLGVYTFTAYFSMCRGYGISMACLLMALFYLFAFVGQLNDRHFAKFVLFIQLALAANLTLLFLALFCSLVAFLVQAFSRKQFRAGTITLHLVNGASIAFWICYAFYLRDNGALYYGEGDSYWQVTFLTLIRSLFGNDRVIPFVVASLFICVAGLSAWQSFRLRLAYVGLPASLSFLLLLALIITFYLLKKISGVNYPEDRTGLFFYPLFVITLFMHLDLVLAGKWRLLSVLPAASAILSASAFFAFTHHPWSVYETMPGSFYELLVEEEKKAGKRITIAGHRIREFIYGFHNYRSDYKLNHMTSPEAFQMNCDYALAVAADEPWYKPYYSVLASEDVWGFRLLKRRQSIRQEIIHEPASPVTWEGDGEYYNCFDLGDSSFTTTEPVQTEVTFRVEKAEKPFRAWFVLQVDGARPEDNIFVRAPLDLIAGDWTKEAEYTLNLTSGTMPARVRRMVLYLWNIDKAPVRIRIRDCRLVRLKAPGINVISRARL